MNEPNWRPEIEQIYRKESRRVLATLIRLLGDFERAEEALADAVTAALEQWVQDGIPDNPRAWLVSTGRFKAIDRLRRQQRFRAAEPELARQWEDIDTEPDWDEQTVADDHLRLIFCCCHPALAREAQLSLTLREVCGLTTEDIARAFLTKPATIAQRIVRAKAKIRKAAIPYEIPDATELGPRLQVVLQVIYLLFNEGYSASSGEDLLRADLGSEALRLGQQLWALLPEAEVGGLLALMLLHDARRATRCTPQGDIILLEDQDRRQWNQQQIAQGDALVEQALKSGRFGPYTLQAAIAALHAQAPSYAETDWTQIAALYELLLRIQPSPVIALNHAVAVAMDQGAEAGLALLDRIQAKGDLRDYHLIHAARADLLRRLGQRSEAIAAYNTALDLAEQEPEQRFLRRRLQELEAGSAPTSSVPCRK